MLTSTVSEKDRNDPIEYFKDILISGFVEILYVSETELNATIVEKEVEGCPKFKVYRMGKSSTSGEIIT